MKKVFIFMMAAMLAAPAFAESNRNDEANFNLTLNLKEMNEDLSLNSDQVSVLASANKSLKYKVSRVAKVSPEKRQQKLSDIVFDNLGTVRSFLSDAQYRKYLTLLNREFNENRLNGVLFGYDMAAE